MLAADQHEEKSSRIATPAETHGGLKWGVVRFEPLRIKPAAKAPGRPPGDPPGAKPTQTEHQKEGHDHFSPVPWSCIVRAASSKAGAAVRLQPGPSPRTAPRCDCAEPLDDRTDFPAGRHLASATTTARDDDAEDVIRARRRRITI